MQIFDKHVPFKIERLTKPEAPWLTNEIKCPMKQRVKPKAQIREKSLCCFQNIK